MSDLKTPLHSDEMREALKLAVGHIEHMAAFITRVNQSGAWRGTYSFESLGEDMPSINAALSTPQTPWRDIRKETVEEMIAAIGLYEAWAAKGDYPHDEQGCEAHEAIRSAFRSLSTPPTKDSNDRTS